MSRGNIYIPYNATAMLCTYDLVTVEYQVHHCRAMSAHRRFGGALQGKVSIRDFSKIKPEGQNQTSDQTCYVWISNVGSPPRVALLFIWRKTYPSEVRKYQLIHIDTIF